MAIRQAKSSGSDEIAKFSQMLRQSGGSGTGVNRASTNNMLQQGHGNGAQHGNNMLQNSNLPTNGGIGTFGNPSQFSLPGFQEQGGQRFDNAYGQQQSNQQIRDRKQEQTQGVSKLIAQATALAKSAMQPIMNAAGSVGGYGQDQQQQDFGFTQPTPFSKSLGDYINDAGDGSNLIAGLLSQFQNERDQGQGRFDQNTSNLDSVFGQMRTDTKQDQGDSAARYQQANQDIAGSGANLQAALKAMDNQTAANAQLGSQELGAGDAAAKAAQTIKESGQPDQVLAAAATDTNTGLNTAQGNSAGDMFDARLNAIAPQQASSQNDLAQSLQDYLSGINSNEASARYQASQDAYNRAVQAYGADSNAYYNDQNNQSQWEQNVWGQQNDLASQQQAAAEAQAQAQGEAVGRDRAAAQLGQYGVNGQDTQSILNLIAGSLANTGYSGSGANANFTPDAVMEYARNNSGGTGSISNWGDVGDEASRAMAYAEYAKNAGVIDDDLYQQMVNIIPTYFAK